MGKLQEFLIYFYCYDIVTGKDSNGNYTYQPNGLVLTVPKYPVMTSMSVNQYNQFVDEYNKNYGAGGILGTDNDNLTSQAYTLDSISEELKNKYYLNNEGNPFNYAPNHTAYNTKNTGNVETDNISDDENNKDGFGLDMCKNTWMELSHSGGTTQLSFTSSIEEEKSKTVSDELSVNMTVMLGASSPLGNFSAYAGISTSIDALRSTGVSTAHITTTCTGGAVQNLDWQYSDYNFIWKLIGWKTNYDDNFFKDILFIGYAVRNVSAPVDPVRDLEAKYNSNTQTVTLTWTEPEISNGRTEISGFNICRKVDSEYNFIKNVPSLGENKINSVEIDVSGSEYSDIEETFAVQSVSASQTAKNSIYSNEAIVLFIMKDTDIKKLVEETKNNLQEKIDAVQENLESSNTANAENLANAIKELTTAYKKADALLKEELEGNLNTEIESIKLLMDEAHKLLKDSIDLVQKNLNNAVAELEKTISDGDKVNEEL